MRPTTVLLCMLLALFLGLTGLVIRQHGYLGFFDWVQYNSATQLMGLDLVIGLAFALLWMRHDAERRGARVMPFVIVTLAIGAAGPLGYVVWRRFVERPRGSAARTALAAVTALVAVLIGTTGALVLFQARESDYDRARLAPPGRLVQVSGRDFHIDCTGAGAPTVLLDMGSGHWSSHWAHVQPRLAAFARVCSFDRPGYGWSAPSPEPRTSLRAADELWAALRAAGESGPYVPVGVSYGGYDARLFASRHPDAVAGMVLAESAHERQWDALPPQVGQFVAAQVPAIRQAALLARFGVMRLMQQAPPDEDEFPEQARAAIVAVASRPELYETLASEIESARESAAQVAATGSLGDLPLVVVTAGRSFEAFRASGGAIPIDEANAVWRDLQRELVGLSSQGSQLVSARATHAIHEDDPDLVVSAIRQVVDQVRQRVGSAPLP